MAYCIVNGRLARAEEAVISVQDRGFRFGDGVFETIAVHQGIPYQFEWHMTRLTSGLWAIKIDFDVKKLRQHCRMLLAKNGVREGILRIQITRGIGSRGYLPDAKHPLAGATWVIETAPLPAIPEKTVALWQTNQVKLSPRALPVRYKLCQGLGSILARMEAEEHHCADALLLNEQGQICETSSGNVFWIKDNILFTPTLACGVLEGSTRAAILRLSSVPVREVSAGIDQLAQAEAVFITNAVWGVLAVGAVLPTNMRWHSEAAAERFYQLLINDKKNYCQNNPLE